jgi:cystathionine beta-lyase
VRIVEPEGTFLVWLDFRQYGLDFKELEDVMIHKAKLALDEGYIFGEEGRGFERINIACPRALLVEALLRLKNTFTASEEETQRNQEIHIEKEARI